MRRILSIIAISGFIITAFIHFAAYIGFNAFEEFQFLWILLIIGFLFIFIISGKLPRQGNWWKAVFSPVPSPIKSILNALTIYVFIHFFVTFALEAGKGFPTRISGEYVTHRIEEGNQRVFISEDDATDDNLEIVYLHSVPTLRMGGEFIEITEDDYYRKTLPSTRIATGHTMIFFLIPAVYFWYQENDEKEKTR